MGRREQDGIEDKDSLLLDEDHEDAADDEFEARAGHAQRGCTDVLCLFFFIGALAGLSFVISYCKTNGDMRRLYHGYNFLGQLCGVDTDENGQVLGEYLYYCPTDGIPGQLDLKHPICVSSCPTGVGVTDCVQMPPQMTPMTKIDAAGSFQQTFTYIRKPLQDYPSKVFAHRYCMPTDNVLISQITQQLQGDWTGRLTTKAGQVIGAWLPLLLSAILACILGMLFLCIVNYFACPLTIMCLGIVILAPLIAGGYFVHVGNNGGLDDMPSTGDAQWDKIVGYTLIIIGVLFAFITCFCQKAVRTAVAVIQTACQCIFDLPTLLLEPVINVLFKSTVLVVMLVGLAWLMSCGTIQKVSLQEYAMSELPGSDLGGVFRTFHYNENEKYYLTYYVFMIFWVMELFTALGQFVVSYAVQLWYFTPYENGEKEDVPCCPVMSGYGAGIFYHLGSLAFGSFIIAVFRLARLMLALLTNQTKDAQNPAMACCVKICACILYCFQKFIEFLNKNAYMDIAITSSNFCPAARRAFKVIFTNMDTIALLNGACWVIQWAGLGAVTSASCYLTWLMLRHCSTFSHSESEHFVDDPVLVTIVSGIVSAYIARAFLHVFDTVADCILYCYAIEKIRRQKGQYGGQMFAPDRLNNLVNGKGEE